ncbi:hypothetical protein XBKB1_4140063 [Xenorhabdus bovienii str. kraussei Becker Underwood]|uniref:Uncharacterized protein n=1 Tax=Xenorhabdus bovienii str. kraussei Becker Underwood TaxID=1398204 RepID=A0A077PMU1_XENBV|nr:hypothetical protein XBKB1_4140063 [Xenorhabdus bovienii str. kraussei Becker Underwood]
MKLLCIVNIRLSGKNALISTEKKLKQFEKLSKKSFACGEDALQALRDFEAECQFIGI